MTAMKNIYMTNPRSLINYGLRAGTTRPYELIMMISSDCLKR